MPLPLSHWKHLAWERTVSSWNTKFLTSPKALRTKKYFPTIYQRLKDGAKSDSTVGPDDCSGNLSNVTHIEVSILRKCYSNLLENWIPAYFYPLSNNPALLICFHDLSHIIHNVTVNESFVFNQAWAAGEKATECALSGDCL
ncbi:hypothetical protein TNCV_2041 [Trichonephila clavipes]|nr:hypothetical protein TNCV_2041 [Trichonephila clavipes]